MRGASPHLTLGSFYRSKYSVNGEDRYMAVTQFEPVDARRAFPCWDEPAVKARFDVTLVVPQNRTAISNMPVVEEKVCGSRGPFRCLAVSLTFRCRPSTTV